MHLILVMSWMGIQISLVLKIVDRVVQSKVVDGVILILQICCISLSLQMNGNETANSISDNSPVDSNSNSRSNIFSSQYVKLYYHITHAAE